VTAWGPTRRGRYRPRRRPDRRGTGRRGRRPGRGWRALTCRHSTSDGAPQAPAARRATRRRERGLRHRHSGSRGSSIWRPAAEDSSPASASRTPRTPCDGAALGAVELELDQLIAVNPHAPGRVDRGDNTVGKLEHRVRRVVGVGTVRRPVLVDPLRNAGHSACGNRLHRADQVFLGTRERRHFPPGSADVPAPIGRMLVYDVVYEAHEHLPR
jgi:hypothetical protein